ncbi:ATP-binding protein [Intrasporangium sp. DVR]|uniref:sensor histidine kinase n=1 Tax=Intrasporangium sp. DVR TaxID=3127867 RepID=UPI00313A70B5
MATSAELRHLPIFEGLGDTQLSQLVAAAEDVPIGAGAVVWREGEHADHWWVLLEGEVELTRRVGHERVVVSHMRSPGQWAGGFRAWDEAGVYLATGQVVAAGRLLRVSAPDLRDLTQAWFPLGGRLIEGIMVTARSIESMARQRGSLITLGTLSAGLAHELNNPASAAARAAEVLSGELPRLIDSIRGLAHHLSPEQFLELDGLRRDLSAPRPPHDAVTLADVEEELTAWLEDHAVARSWEVAASLASSGADESWCERALDILGADSLGSGLAWVASTVSVSSLLEEMQESTRRVSGIVAAVRSYTQMDRASRQQVDVRDGLESTLVVLGPRLREGDGIAVVRDYGDAVPEVDAHPGELNQVWTNLIDNAVDAMGGSGTLGICTRADGDGLLVEISDTGEGMAADVAERAFEAFYTTKQVGSGTGLGLDIARRIVVDRHGGDISVESTPGRTVFRVRLPRTRPEAE